MRVVGRNLTQPFAAGEIIACAEHHYTIVMIEAAEQPREGQLLVKRMP